MKNKILLSVIVLLLVLSIPTQSIAKTKINKRNLPYLQGFVVTMWNDNVCEFSWYYTEHTDSCGMEMDPDKVLDDWEQNLKKVEKWDKVVNKLKGKKYTKLKKYWKVYSAEYKKLYKRVKRELPEIRNDDEPNILGVDKFEKYMWKLSLLDSKYFK